MSLRDRHSSIGYFALAASATLAAALVWAPLPFGSVHRWAETLLQAAAAVALLLAAPALADRRRLPPALPAAAVGLLALFGLLQTVPLPPWLVGVLSPGHLAVDRAAAAVLGGGGWPALTLDAAATRRTAVVLAALAAAFAAAAIAGRRRRRRRLLAASLLAAVGFQLLYGFRHLLAGSRDIWGVEVVVMADRLRGTFVNANHLAYLVEMALVVVFAWAWWGWREARREPALDRRLWLVVPPVAVWLGLFVALSFTRSRAGLLAAIVAVGIQGMLPALRRRRYRAAAIGVAAAAAGLALVAVLGMERGLGRLLATRGADLLGGARAQMTLRTLELWTSYPLTGSGLGTFRDAFTAVETPQLRTGIWYHAHNDPAELLATGGVVGFGLAALAVALLARRLLRALRDGRRAEDRAAALAGLGALVSIGVHECFDFGLTVPANGFTFAVLLGAAAAAPLLDQRELLDGRRADARRPHLEEVEPGGGLGGSP